MLHTLTALGCVLSSPITQEDSVFTPRGSSHPVPSGTNVLRIRKQNDKYILTLKQPQINELDCIEKEVEIKNPEIYIDMFKLLGFEAFSHVKKTRQTCTYNGYDICLDEVEDLGTFIEVEKITDGNNSEKVQEELFTFLESLGIKKEDQVIHGYDILIKKLE